MSAVIIQDEIVHYEVLGRGRPVIFLHTWIGSWRYWIPTMQAVSISYRTYAIDFWGFGDTSNHSQAYQIDKQSQLLEDFMTKLGIGKVALVGHGLGAIISLHFTEKHPASVDRVLAVGLPMTATSINKRLYDGSIADTKDWQPNSDPDYQSITQEIGKNDGDAIHQSLASLDHYMFQKTKDQITRPMLLVNGNKDLVVSPLPVSENDDLPPNYHQIEFDDSSHYPMLDESSKFNRLVLDFLSLETEQSPRHLQVKEEWKRRIR